MSFDPTSLISLIQNCKTLFDYAADVKHSSTERTRLLDEVRSLEPELEALQRLTNTPGVAVMERTLSYIKDVLTYGTSDPHANRFKVFGRRGAAALWWTVDKREVKELLSDLERYKRRIGLALQHDMFNHIITEYRLKIAKFISEDDFTGHQRPLIEQRLPETGTWVLRHPKFVTWRDNEDSDRTVWCHGFAGVGKSVIAALIVEHLQSTPGTIVLSVFCRYDNITTLSTPFPVLRGLLRQLIEKTPNVLPALYELYQSQTEPKPNALRVLLNDLAAYHTRPIYIVIDALDECPIRIGLLRAVQDLAPFFRILVTSRPVFQEIDEHATIEIRATDKDIFTAIDTTLQKLKYTWLDRELKQVIRDKVVGIADGMFLLASLQLRELEQDVTCRHDVVAILDSLPRTLDNAYKSTFQRIREQGERKNELACHALALVALQSPFLGIRQVRHLLAGGDAARYTDIEAILHCCRGLLRIDNAFLQFIHYSAYEYTSAHWLELFPEHPNRSNLCLALGYSSLTNLINKQRLDLECWGDVAEAMTEPEEIQQVISLLLTPAARASLIGYLPELTPFVHDPFLVACNRGYWHVVKYMIETAPLDVQRFNEALRVCTSKGMLLSRCIIFINARPDMRVNSRGEVVAVDLDGGERHSSSSEDEDAESSICHTDARSWGLDPES